MEVEPVTFDSILDWLRKHAAKGQTSLIVEARIAISPQDVRLLDFQPATRLETISY